jgi:hypothetical protein
MSMPRRISRVLAVLASAVISIGLVGQPTLVRAVSAQQLSLSAWGTARIDGVRGSGEWDGAARIDFQATLPAVDGGATVPASVYVMNDAKNMYLASDLAAIAGCTYNPIFEFDNDNDGDPNEIGSDWVAAHVPPGTSGPEPLLDMFVYPVGNVGFDTYTASGYPPAGTIDGAAAGGHPGGTSTWVEMSHPLDSGDDAHDFSLTLGDTVGLLFEAHTTGTGCGTCIGPACHGSTIVPSVGLAQVVVHRDLESPVITSSPRVAGAVPSTLGSGSTLISWKGSDGAGTGVDGYQLQQQKDAGSWTTIASTTANHVTRSLALGHSYRYRVRAHDHAGNVGAWAAGSTVVPELVQGSSSRVHYPIGTWHTQTTTNASGGSTRWSTSTSARATFSFTGRAVAWVASTGSNRGRVNVYVDGVLRTKVNLVASSTHWKRVLFSASWSSRSIHTIELRSALSGYRIDVDAFVVYK